MPTNIWDCECIDSFHKDEPDDIYVDGDDDGWGSHGKTEPEPEVKWDEDDDLESVIKNV